MYYVYTRMYNMYIKCTCTYDLHPCILTHMCFCAPEIGGQCSLSKEFMLTCCLQGTPALHSWHLCCAVPSDQTIHTNDVINGGLLCSLLRTEVLVPEFTHTGVPCLQDSPHKHLGWEGVVIFLLGDLPGNLPCVVICRY